MSEDITRISLDTAIDHDRTDWVRLHAMSDADIEMAIAGDDDAFAIDHALSSPTVGVRYVTYRSADGGWRWMLKDRDGAQLAVSAISFTSKEAVFSAIDSLRFKLLTGDVKAA